MMIYKIKLVICSNLHSIAEVVGPIFFMPICIHVIATIETNIAIITVYIHAVGVNCRVIVDETVPTITSEAEVNAQV